MNDAFSAGMKVVGSDGEAGTVEDILYDKDGAARYLVVRDRGVFGRDAVLPVAGAQPGEGVVRVAMTRDQIHQAERYDPAKYGPGAGLVSGSAARYDQQDEENR